MSRGPSGLGVAALAVLLGVLALLADERSTTVALGAGGGLAISAPTWVFLLSGSLVCGGAAAGVAVFARSGWGRWVTTLRAAAGAVTVTATLTLLASGGTVNVAAILAMTIAGSVAIVLGSTSGVLAERSGTFNIAIEGQLLMGAFAAALVATLTQSPWWGLLAGVLAGIGNASILAATTVFFRVNQVVSGFILVSLSLGLTGYLTAQLMVPDPDRYNSPPTLQDVDLPVLADLPVVGPALFDQNAVFYLCVATVLAVHFFLSHTVIGLRIRSVGENPSAAFSSGVDARRVRFWATTLSGAIGGLGGAAFTVGSSGQFVAGMSSGLGFVALAAVILGGWRPIPAAGAALLFGFATSLAAVLSLLDVAISPTLLLIAPYAVTVAVVARGARRLRAPAAAGNPLP